MQGNRTARSMVVMLAAAWILADVVGLVAQRQDPFVGTWELNAAKSTFSVPATAYKRSTIKIEKVGDGQTIDVDSEPVNGRGIHYTLTAFFDGKDHPVEGIGTVTLKRVDARTVERVHKTDGKPTLTILSRVSSDGKTLSVTQTGTGRDGKPMKSQLLYEKK